MVYSISNSSKLMLYVRRDLGRLGILGFYKFSIDEKSQFKQSENKNMKAVRVKRSYHISAFS